MRETSIIIRAFNEEKRLPALFDSLAAQVYRDFEVVVVDSGSFDRTREIAGQRADKLIRIRPEDFTFGHSLNVGIRESRGRFVAIVSAHAAPTNDHWLARLVASLEDAETAIVYGRQIGCDSSKFSERMDFERTFGASAKVVRLPKFFANNANSAIRRELWEQYPFDETLPGLEDMAWARHWVRRGYRVVYAPDACVYHIHEESWPQVRRRYYREGQAAKWIRIRGRRDIPREIWRETRSLVADAVEAARRGDLTRTGAEIARFRFEKLIGTVAGVWNGATTQNPMTRERLFFNRTCHAVVIRGPGRAALETVELSPMKPGDVVLRVAYEGVCATDLEVLDGELGYYKTGLAKYPIVPGHEFSGTIAAVGSRVTEFAEGDRVVVECIQGCGSCAACQRRNWIGCEERREVGVIGLDGGYAQYVVTPGRFVHRLPPGVGLKEAALCEPLAVVLRGLRRIERVWNDRVFQHRCAVIGAGPIGHLVARVLAHRGHQVTVFDRNPRRLACLAGSGVQTVERFTSASGFDGVAEASGSADALDTALRTSEAGAVLLLFGLPYGKRDFNFETLVGHDKIVVGSVGSGAEDFEEALAMLPKFDLGSLTGSVMSLLEFRQAWSLARAGEHLKILLCVDEQNV